MLYTGIHGWAVKDSNLRRAKPDWFTASSDWPLRQLPMEPTVRFELTTSCLQNSCSTTELRRRAKLDLGRHLSGYGALLYGFFKVVSVETASNYTVPTQACQAGFPAPMKAKSKSQPVGATQCGRSGRSRALSPATHLNRVITGPNRRNCRGDPMWSPRSQP